jgi:hypothetical protein
MDRDSPDEQVVSGRVWLNRKGTWFSYLAGNCTQTAKYGPWSVDVVIEFPTSGAPLRSSAT